VFPVRYEIKRVICDLSIITTKFPLLLPVVNE
jgi:hypothetical protein